MHISITDTAQRVLTLRKEFRAPRDKVFAVWTRPDYLRKWFFAEDGWSVRDAQVDLRVGGEYELAIFTEDGTDVSIGGTYLEVRENESLSYTWSTGALGERETFIVVNFLENSQGSRISLNHGRFMNQQEADLHAEGWQRVLNRLETLLYEI